MKVQILARPDHSLYLYNYLKKQVAVQLICFNVARKNSLLHRFRPSTKLVDKDVIVLNDLTFYDQIIFWLGKKAILDPYKWESLYAEFAFATRARSFKPDIIHYWPVYCHHFVKKQREAKQVCTVADVYSAHPEHVVKCVQPEYEKYGLDITKSYFYIDAKRNTDFLTHENYIITTSNYVRESFLEYSPSKNIFVADYGFLGDANSLPTYEDALNYQHAHKSPILKLVYVGTVSIEKGVPYLLEAMKRLQSSSIQLDIIGPIKDGQEKIFQPYYSMKTVKFLGAKSNKEIKRMLKKYSSLILPSLSDAYSLAVIEGLQNALPVIITDHTGSKDAVQKYNVGEIVPAGCIKSLSAAIERMTDPEYRRQLAQNIKNFIIEDLEYPYPMKVLDIYKALLSEPS